MSTAIVNAAMTQMEAWLQSIAGITNRIERVTSVDKLDARLSAIPRPWVGMIYEGMRENNNIPKVTHNTGLGAEMVMVLCILVDAETTSTVSEDVEIVTLLDTIRDKIKGKRGPSQHFWRFRVEAAAKEQDGYVLWVQRWSLPVMLT